jgi:hypothetical protein
MDSSLGMGFDAWETQASPHARENIGPTRPPPQISKKGASGVPSLARGRQSPHHTSTLSSGYKQELLCLFLLFCLFVFHSFSGIFIKRGEQGGRMEGEVGR